MAGAPGLVCIGQSHRLCPVSSVAPYQRTLRAQHCFVSATALLGNRLRRQHHSVRDVAHCATPPDQQTSTTGRQEEPHLSHSDRYNRSQRKLPYKAIIALALGGTALTAYLTASKLSGAPVVCLASGGCGSVLNSDYATIFGLPLSLLGLGAYSTTAALAFKGAASTSAKQPLSEYGVLAGGAILASCSASLL